MTILKANNAAGITKFANLYKIYLLLLNQHSGNELISIHELKITSHDRFLFFVYAEERNSTKNLILAREIKKCKLLKKIITPKEIFSLK